MRKSIVSDTGSLISLEKMSKGYSFIQKLYQKIIIPSEVIEELSYHYPSPDSYLEEYGIRDLIEIREVAINDSLQGISDLHEGEQAAISLAYQLRIGLLIEEINGRDVAEQAGIEFSGIGGQIVLAQHRGILTLSESQDRLKEMLHHKRLNNEIYQILLSKLH